MKWQSCLIMSALEDGSWKIAEVCMLRNIFPFDNVTTCQKLGLARMIKAAFCWVIFLKQANWTKKALRENLKAFDGFAFGTSKRKNFAK